MQGINAAYCYTSLFMGYIYHIMQLKEVATSSHIYSIRSYTTVVNTKPPKWAFSNKHTHMNPLATLDIDNQKVILKSLIECYSQVAWKTRKEQRKSSRKNKKGYFHQRKIPRLLKAQNKVFPRYQVTLLVKIHPVFPLRSMYTVNKILYLLLSHHRHTQKNKHHSSDQLRTFEERKAKKQRKSRNTSTKYSDKITEATWKSLASLQDSSRTRSPLNRVRAQSKSSLNQELMCYSFKVATESQKMESRKTYNSEDR